MINYKLIDINLLKNTNGYLVQFFCKLNKYTMQLLHRKIMFRIYIKANFEKIDKYIKYN